MDPPTPAWPSPNLVEPLRPTVEPETKRVRRNGIASSCEPCRKSKLACNHELPCSRCTRGRKECYYHPSPMSRTGNATSNSPALSALPLPPPLPPPSKEPLVPSTPEKASSTRNAFEPPRTKVGQVLLHQTPSAHLLLTTFSRKDMEKNQGNGVHRSQLLLALVLSRVLAVRAIPTALWLTLKPQMTFSPFNPHCS